MLNNYSTKIICGKYELVLSESIIMDSLDSELVIDLVVGTIHMGNIRFCFLMKEGEEVSIKSHGNNGELILECINFDGSTDTGTIEMIPIGKAEGKELKMHLWMTMLGNQKVRKVEINLYKEL